MSNVNIIDQNVWFSSRNRDSGSNEDFKTNLNLALGNRVKGVKLVSFKGVNTFYNVRSGHNVFSMTENGQARQDLTLTPGYYTSTDLFTALKSLVDAALVAGSVAFSLEDYTYKIKIVFTGTTAAINVDATHTLARTIGFDATSADAASHTATYTPKLGGLDEIFVVSRALGEFHMIDAQKKSTRDVVGIVPNSTEFLGKIWWESDTNDGVIQFVQPRIIRDVDIRLENSNGDLLDFKDEDVKLEFRFYY